MNYVEEEAKRRAELIRKAFKEGRVASFRWNNDGSGCEFLYVGVDNHGMKSEFLSNLNQKNAIYAMSGIWMCFDKTKPEQHPRLTPLEKTTRLCELVSELKAAEEQLSVIREHTEQMIIDEQEE